MSYDSNAGYRLVKPGSMPVSPSEPHEERIKISTRLHSSFDEEEWIAETSYGFQIC